MRVLLAMPPYDFRDFYPEYMARKNKDGSGFGRIPGATPPLGLLYLAAVLRQAGHDVLFLDGIFAGEDVLIDTIKRHDVGLVGLSMLGYGWHKGQGFLRRLKEACPDVPIAIGGPWPDIQQAECLKENEAVDFAAAGDGEYILRDLVAALENKTPLRDVRGIAFRDGDKIVVNPHRELIHDLDEVPFPARDLVNIRQYHPAIGHYHRLPCTTMIGQRGCQWACIFCHTNTWMRHHERYRSPGNVVDEMELLERKYGVRDILFWDNNLTQDRDSIHARCEEKIRRGLDVIWSGNTRCDTLDLETARLLKRAGCWKVLIGFESGVQKNVDALHKGESLADYEEAMAICRQAGLRVFATFIFGIPGETYREGLETIEFAKKLNADYTKFFTLGAHPGTDLWKNLDKYGTCLGGDSQAHLNAGFVPYSMTRPELIDLLHRANQAFYMRPGYLLKKLRTVDSWEDVRQNWKGFQAFSRAGLERLRAAG